MQYLILFDIDGTILQFREGYSKIIFSEMFEKLFQINFDVNKMPDFSGKTDLQILREIADNYNLDSNRIFDRIDSIWDEIYRTFEIHCNNANLKLMPGAKLLIEEFHFDKRTQLGLLTGNFKDNAYLKLKVFELEKYFPFGAFGSDNSDRNALPELAVERAKTLFKEGQFSIGRTVIIGDSPRDIECAQKSGAFSVAVATGSFTYEELFSHNPDLIFQNFLDYRSVKEQIIELCIEAK